MIARADVTKIYDYCLLKDNFLPIQDYISQKELMKSNESMSRFLFINTFHEFYTLLAQNEKYPKRNQ